MLEVIHVATVAWQAVSQDTILNCFHHAELKKKRTACETETIVEESKNLNPVTKDFSYLMQILEKYVLLSEKSHF